MAYLTRDFNQITFVYSDQAACIVTHETVSVYRKNMFIMNKKIIHYCRMYNAVRVSLSISVLKVCNSVQVNIHVKHLKQRKRIVNPQKKPPIVIVVLGRVQDQGWT